MRTLWTGIGQVQVKALDFSPNHAGPAVGTVVLMPGLGLPRYTRPTAQALVRLGLRCVVLDVLASRLDRPRVAPDVASLGQAAAGWVQATTLDGPLVLFGHSTGAQAALTAALHLQALVHSLSVVLAGPTFQPQHRTAGGLGRAAATAYRRDSPRELVVLRDLARVRTDVLRIIRSAQRDRPEERIRALHAPLLLTAGEHDTLASLEWMQRLAAASAGDSPRVVTLAGSHNNLWTHPQQIASLVELHARSAAP